VVSATLQRVRRFALAVIVAILTFSATGVSAFVIGEPCTGYEQSTGDDGACPPTCVTCGCCAQAAEPVVLALAISSVGPVAQIVTPVPAFPKTEPGAVLHVPKAYSA
jgi:hypothetical protein